MANNRPRRSGPLCCSAPSLTDSALAKDWDSPEDAIYDDNQHTDTIGATVTHTSYSWRLR